MQIKTNSNVFQLIFPQENKQCYLEDLVSTGHWSDFVVGVGPSQFTQMTHGPFADFTVHVHLLHLMLRTHEHLRNLINKTHIVIVLGSHPGHKCCTQLHTIVRSIQPYIQGVKIRPQECRKHSAAKQITACKNKATQIKKLSSSEIARGTCRRFWNKAAKYRDTRAFL